MFIEDRLYSANEVTGGMDDNERFYSAEEVGLINDLFSEYYEAHEDFYSDDVERAYADFYDAYSVMDNNFSVKLKEVKRPDPKIEEAEGDKPKYTIGPKTTAGIVTGVGAGAGYLASRLWTKKDKARKAELANKVSKGLASKSDIAELNAINKKLGRKTVGATIAGAGLAYGGLAIANRLAVSKHLAKDKNNSAKDMHDFIDNNIILHDGKGNKPTIFKIDNDGKTDKRSEFHKRELKHAAIGVAGGAVVGGAASLIKNRKRLNELRKLGSSRTPEQSAEYKKLKMNVLKSAGVGAAVGGATGYGASRSGLITGMKVDRLAHKYAKDNNLVSLNSRTRNTLNGASQYRKLRDTSNSEEDSYSFEEFYSDNEAHYGDNLEEAFSDYVEAIDAEDNYNLVESVGNVATGAGKVAGNILGSRTKTMAIGTGVSMMRGKSAVSGAKQGFGAHMVGKQITNGVSQFKTPNA
jgi:hypothetical protein